MSPFQTVPAVARARAALESRDGADAITRPRATSSAKPSVRCMPSEMIPDHGGVSHRRASLVRVTGALAGPGESRPRPVGCGWCTNPCTPYEGGIHETLYLDWGRHCPGGRLGRRGR